MRSKTLFKSKRGAVRTGLITIFAVLAVLLAALIYFGAERNRTNDRLDRLAMQNSALQAALKDAQKQIDEMSSGDSSPAARKQSEETLIARSPQPAEETETLFLQEPAVEQTADGLLVHLKYVPEAGTELPETTTIVFRVSDAGTAKIVSLNAAGSDAKAIISPKKTLAMIECSPAEIGSLEFKLTVSEPTTATARGSEGIIDFEMDITPAGCSVRSL